MKRLYKRLQQQNITEQNLEKHLIDKQFSYVGKTWEQVKDDPNWAYSYNLTKQQHNEWKEYSIKQIQNVYKFTHQQAELEFNWIYIGYGLSIKK